MNLTAGGLSGGYRKYLQAVVPLLSRDRRVSCLTVFNPGGEGWPQLEAETITMVRGDEWRGFLELRRRLRELGPDVVFVPTARWLRCGLTPVVVMMRNMEPLLAPREGNAFSEKARNWGRSVVARRACQRADRVIAVSRFVRDVVVERWRIPEERIGVVTHGTDAPLVAAEQAPPTGVAAVGAFIFAAGSIRPARGLRELIEAAAILKRRNLLHSVVVAGSATPDSEAWAAQLERRAADLGVAESVHWLGQLDRAEMAWCFAHCTVYAHTSWAEACPNTVLEALSYGCLAVSTDQPPMPEFFADAAYYYTARDAVALANKLAEALGVAPVQQEAKRAAARERAKCFDWKRTADKTLLELQKVAGQAVRGKPGVHSFAGD